jgi:hypothetical protein
MSKRTVVIRILGLGDTDSDDAAMFSTRGIAKGLGTVVSLANQLSSEIQVFGSLGSDSTTSFTVLSTAYTRRLLMSRGKVEVRDTARNQPIRFSNYLMATPGVVSFPTITGITVGGYYRVQNTVFRILTTGPTTAIRVWGCAPVPIAMASQSTDELIGPIVYDLNDGNPLGGCEQLPVVISTQEADGSDVEVIFRGFVSKVSNDTSAGQQNLIKVDCSSMMAYLKQSPFVPSWGTVATDTTGGDGGEFTRSDRSHTLAGRYKTQWESKLYGPIYDPAAPVTAATRSKLWQIRDGDIGGIGAFTDFGFDEVGISSVYTIAFGGSATVTDNGFRMSFTKGYYLNGDYGPLLEMGGEIDPNAYGYDRPGWNSRLLPQKPSLRGENCFESNSFASCIIDLLLGCYDADITLASGARSATESAWLPYDYTSIDDVIDTASLYALTQGLNNPDIAVVGFIPQESGFVTLLPYEPDKVKTVGEVLEAILKRLGAYMVCDKGKFYFGSWAGKRQAPAFVTDADLSDPSIKLTFDRGLSLMRVNVVYANYDTEFIKYDVPYNNPDLSTANLGKEISIGHWQIPFKAPDDPSWGYSRMVANAFGLLMRYSQSAARVDLSLRDSQVDLKVGQEVAVTSQYLVNSEGEMGVSVLTGYVLKAARSWATPTTAYTIILPGYLSPANKVKVWSCSARVDDVPGGDFIQVDANYFTAPPGLASEEAPVTDAEAFERTQALIGSWYDVQLLDQYGTFKYQGAAVGVDLPNNRLELPGFDTYAVPGDIIVLAPATSFGAPELALIWDAFQANNAGQVDGLTANASKWVP